MKKNKPSQIKQKYLNELGVNLQYYYPVRTDCFLCPVCLNFTSLKFKNKISIAHIVPKYAKGNLKTLLCQKCNSDFGRKQDKWFGEFLRLLKEEKHYLQTAIKPSYFHIDGVKINGTFDFTSDNRVKVLIKSARNSSEINSIVRNDFRQNAPKSIKFSIPILQQERNFRVGFLTAAYLMFFATFGYSWVLQSYLAPIRNQILSPEDDIVKDIYFAKFTDVDNEAWIGVIDFMGKYALSAGFMGYGVVIPPVTDVNIYSYILQRTKGTKNTNIPSVAYYPMVFTNRHLYDAPVNLMFDKKLMFASDAYVNNLLQAITIHFSPEINEAQFLYPTPDAAYEKMRNEPDAQEIKVKMRGKINTKENLYDYPKQ